MLFFLHLSLWNFVIQQRFVQTYCSILSSQQLPCISLPPSPSFTGLVSDSTCAGVHKRPAAETLAPFTPRLWDVPQLWTGWSSERQFEGEERSRRSYREFLQGTEWRKDRERFESWILCTGPTEEIWTCQCTETCPDSICGCGWGWRCGRWWCVCWLLCSIR